MLAIAYGAKFVSPKLLARREERERRERVRKGRLDTMFATFSSSSIALLIEITMTTKSKSYVTSDTDVTGLW